MKLSYDGKQNVPSQIILAKPGEIPLFCLNSIDPDSTSLKLNLKDLNTLSFSINQYVFDNLRLEFIKANGYDIIDSSMELHVTNFGWFRINSTPRVDNDGYIETKTISAESIETELQTKNIIGLEVNRGTEGSLEMLIKDNLRDMGNGLILPKRQIYLYDKNNPDYSLMDILLKDTYRWSVGYVDADIASKIATFDIQNSNLYSIFVNDISQAYECIIVFDNENFTVNAYSLNAENVLNRGMFKDTNIIIGFRGIQNSLSVSSDQDIYTVYNVQGDSDLGIEYANFGSSKIENIDYFLNTKYMSQDLIDKYKTWRDYRESRRQDYINITKKYNDQLDVVTDLQDRVPSAGCQTDWTKIKDDELLASYSNYVALQAGYESTYVDSNGKFDLVAIKKSIDWEDYYSTITYTIPAIKNEIALRGLDSNISASGKVDYDYDSWETDWDLYGVSELETKRDNYDEQLTTLKASGFDKSWDQVKDDDSNSFTEDYFIKMHELYLKYKSERSDCNNALTKRKKELDTANSTLESYNNTRKSICDDVSKDNAKYGFDRSDLSILWKLYNEVDYVNNNFFVSTVDNLTSTADIQYDLFKDATTELEKNSQPQYTYSSTLDNFLAMYDYRMFHEDVNCGNFIRVMIDDTHQVKLRIISIQFNPCVWDNDLSIEYSNFIKTRSGWTDKTDLLDISSNQKNNSITGTSKGTSGIDITQQMINVLLKSSQFKNYSNNLTNNVISQVTGSLTVNGMLTTEQLAAKLAKIDTLEANSAFVKYMESQLIVSDKIITKILQADQARIDDLSAKIITANSINSVLIQTDVIKAMQGNFTEISADTANIKQILAGHIGTGDLQTINITAENATFSDAAIKKLIAAHISVGDLQAGNIVLSDAMKIVSENGNLTMNGQALQITGKDSGGKEYVGVQLGYDTNSNPSLILRNETGATVLTPDGITADAIADELIVNDMIKDGTINEGKLGFQVVKPNAQGGIDISQIYDGKGGLWGVEYESFKEEVNKQLDERSIDVKVYSSLGSQIKNGTGQGAAYALVYQDNTEIDTLKTTVFSKTAPSSPNVGDFYYNIDSSKKTVTLMKYNGTTWGIVTGEDLPQQKYEWYRRNNKGEIIDKTPYATGKVIYIDGTIINSQVTVGCYVTVTI